MITKSLQNWNTWRHCRSVWLNNWSWAVNVVKSIKSKQSSLMSHQRARMQWLRSLADFNLVTNRYWKVPHVAKRQKDVDTWYIIHRGSNTHILDTVQLSPLDWSWYHWYTQTAGCPAAYCQSMQERGDKFWKHTKACMLIQGRFAVAARKIENPSERQHAGKLLKFAALRILIKYSFWLDEALFFFFVMLLHCPGCKRARHPSMCPAHWWGGTEGESRRTLL